MQVSFAPLLGALANAPALTYLQFMWSQPGICQGHLPRPFHQLQSLDLNPADAACLLPPETDAETARSCSRSIARDVVTNTCCTDAGVFITPSPHLPALGGRPVDSDFRFSSTLILTGPAMPISPHLTRLCIADPAEDDDDNDTACASEA